MPIRSLSKIHAAVACLASFAILASCDDEAAETAPVNSTIEDERDAFGIRWAHADFDTLRDPRDGQTYRTVRVGDQVWMAQNLNFKVDSSWCFSQSPDSCGKYGRLYHWSAAMGLADSCNRRICSTQVKSNEARGICPADWKIPSDVQWEKLLQVVGGRTGAFLKSKDGWKSPGNGSDSVGFRGLPAGDRISDGSFSNNGSGTSFWSADESASGYVWRRSLSSGSSYASRVGSYKWHGFSVRCVRQLP